MIKENIELHTVAVDDKTLYQLMVNDLRYSFPRDNNLAPWGCCSIIKEYLPSMGDDFRSATAKQLVEEVIEHLDHPSLYGATKRKVLQPIGDNYRASYMTKCEIDDLDHSPYDVSGYIISKEYRFEYEDEWLDLIKFLKGFIEEHWRPYNDPIGKFYK